MHISRVKATFILKKFILPEVAPIAKKTRKVILNSSTKIQHYLNTPYLVTDIKSNVKKNRFSISLIRAFDGY